MADEAVVAESEPLTPEQEAKLTSFFARNSQALAQLRRRCWEVRVQIHQDERRRQEFARQTAWDRAENLSHQRQVEQRHQQRAQERQQHREAAAWREARELLL